MPNPSQNSWSWSICSHIYTLPTATHHLTISTISVLGHACKERAGGTMKSRCTAWLSHLVSCTIKLGCSFMAKSRSCPWQHNPDAASVSLHVHNWPHLAIWASIVASSRLAHLNQLTLVWVHLCVCCPPLPSCKDAQAVAQQENGSSPYGLSESPLPLQPISTSLPSLKL